MDLQVLILYLAVWALQIGLLVRCGKHPTYGRWKFLFLFIPLCALAAFGMVFVFDALPARSEFMPGLAWLGEIIYSFLASAVYALMFLVCLAVWLVQRHRQRKVS